MKNKTTQIAIITGVICFIVGGSVGYAARSHTKLTLEEFRRQLTRLSGPETVELSHVLDEALMKPREVGK